MTTRDETIQLISDLKARNLPHASSKDVRIPNGLTAEEIDKVLEPYAAPQEKCLGGDHRIWFQWGLAHGSGYCTQCGFPVAMYHYITDSDGKKHRLEIGLQPHPDYLSVEEE